ncbi:MAG TPA: M35 family metallopeptidase [Pyrinomonadaceae bacterium]|jgi:hypothetical protein
MPILEGNLVPSAGYESDKAVGMGFELTNNGDQDLYVLTWYTPLEGLYSDCLSVLRDGERLPYDGVLPKRGAPTADDYVLVPAGKTVSNVVELSGAYEVSRPGDYEVKLDTDVDLFDHPSSLESRGMGDGFRAASAEKQPLREGGARFAVARGEGRRRPTRGQAARRSGRRRQRDADEESGARDAGGPMAPFISGADPNQQAVIGSAHAYGYALCVASLASLANDARYVEWFGVPTTQRFNKVRDGFARIRRRMETARYSYILGSGKCVSGWRAYTYKHETRIWLCPPFWDLPDGGRDSKISTLLHEHSHTSALTDDLRYDQTSCRLFAMAEPERAVRNAANYEYYAS